MLLAFAAGSVTAAVPYANADDLKDKRTGSSPRSKAAEAELENTSHAAVRGTTAHADAQIRLGRRSGR